MKLKLPKTTDIQNKTVLIRVDYNVPLEKKDGKYTVSDSRRIESSLETINFLLENKAKIIAISHLGRPKNKEEKYSLLPVAEHIKSQYQLPISFAPDCIGESVKQKIDSINPGEILLLENLRYYPEEKENDPNFSKQLSELADVYINEAFSNSHRSHASMVGITKHLPSFAGFGLVKEVENLSKVTSKPKKPFIVIIGGAKISDKVEAVEHLSKIADAVLVGGGVANNFLKAEGIEIHKSYLQDTPSDLKKEGINYVKVADHLIEEHKTEKIFKDGYIPLPKIIYPADVVAASTSVMSEGNESENSNNKNCDNSKIETQIIDLTHDAQDTPDDKDLMYLDIGPKTTRLYTELIASAGTIFWNGPMGVFEKDEFSYGTFEIARAISKATKENGAVSILGGGDTIAAVDELRDEDSLQFTYISTAGGASLDFLAGKILPGLEGVVESQF